MRKNKISYLIMSVIMLFMLTITVTFAWFFVNQQVEVDYGSEIICQAGTSLELSMLEGYDENNEEVWSPYSGYVRYSETSAKIEDITGDGKELYVPSSLMTNPETGELLPEGLKEAEKTDEDGYGQYLEMKVKFKSLSSMNIYLSGDSLVKPATTSDTDRNAFGNFSKHYIVGAIRVAILSVDENDNEEIKMIWAPSPKVELSYNKKTGKYSLDTNGNIEEYSYYKKNPATGVVERYYVTSDDYANKRFVLGSTNTNETFTNNSPLLGQVLPVLGENFGEEKLVIRVWYEGTDREANQALGGGQVKLNLKFIGMNAKSPATKEMEDSVNNITTEKTEGRYSFNNVSEGILYSLNGYEWKKYDTTSQTLINSYLKEQKKDTKVYFKSPETDLYYEYMKYILLKYEGEIENET